MCGTGGFSRYGGVLGKSNHGWETSIAPCSFQVVSAGSQANELHAIRVLLLRLFKI